MKKIYSFLLLALILASTACTDDLNQSPVIEQSSSSVYTTAEGYKMTLAKIYGSYSLAGQEKGGSNADISSFNGQDLLRSYFNLQEAPTDETAMRWLSGDKLTDLSYMSWDANDSWVADTYYRLYYSIALCNEFLRYCSDDQISKFSTSEQAQIRNYRLEARFMRALNYYLVLDLFRQGPFVDESSPASAYVPEAYTGQQLFDYIETEIQAIVNELPDTNEYGRASQAAVWALAAKLYLNAAVYTDTNHYTECITYCKKILDTHRYSLESDYAKLFNADNDKRTNEILFAFVVDANTTMTWGATTYIVCGSCGSDSSQDPSAYGLSSGWGSWRVRGEFSALFGDVSSSQDKRCLLWTDGQSQYINKSLDEGTQGYYSEKWTNLTDGGEASSDSASDGVNTDFPMFRLADIHLMAAEAVLRGGTGMTRGEALTLVNQVRERAYGDTSGHITDAQLDLKFMIEERGRELYQEATRRTDLIRFGQFTTSDYIWQWKGGLVDGRAVDNKYNVYPIPAAELTVNPNLSNPNY